MMIAAQKFERLKSRRPEKLSKLLREIEAQSSVPFHLQLPTCVEKLPALTDHPFLPKNLTETTNFSSIPQGLHHHRLKLVQDTQSIGEVQDKSASPPQRTGCALEEQEILTVTVKKAKAGEEVKSSIARLSCHKGTAIGLDDLKSAPARNLDIVRRLVNPQTMVASLPERRTHASDSTALVKNSTGDGNLEMLH